MGGQSGKKWGWVKGMSYAGKRDGNDGDGGGGGDGGIAGMADVGMGLGLGSVTDLVGRRW